MSDTRETPGETDNKAEQLAAHKKKGLSQTVEAMCKEFVEEEPDPIPQESMVSFGGALTNEQQSDSCCS